MLGRSRKEVTAVKCQKFSIFVGLIIFCVVMIELFFYWETTFTDGEVQPLPKIACRRDVLNQVTRGVWRKRKNITSKDEFQREQMDIEIRKDRDLPVVLHRDDMRCGDKFPLVGHNGFPSLCEANSSAPCCNHNEGRCGSGRGNCSCHRCTDFRTQISAELFDYIPSSGCAFKNFTSKEACQFMNKRVSNLTLVGDSLMGHLSNAMMILFTDDPREGSLQKDITNNERKKCLYDFQFVDSGKSLCNTKTSQKISKLPKNRFCQGLHKFSYSCVEGYNLPRASWAHNAVRENLHKSNSVVAIGVGLHMNLVFEQVKKYMEPVLQLKKQANSEWPYIIWITIHAHGSQTSHYSETQSHLRILRFNQQMRDYLAPRGVPVFDFFNLTIGIKSYDGHHFGFGVNMMKAQLLMNFLEEKFGQ